MRPDARVQSAIQILDHWLLDETGLDRILAQWGRSNRYAGSGDRSAIADLVYSAVRRLRSATWVTGRNEPTSGRVLLHGAMLLDDVDPETLFTGTRHAPDLLDADEVQARRDLTKAPHAIRFDYPDWLEDHFSDCPKDDLDALRGRASLDLRVNTLKADRPQAVAALARDDILAEPDANIATALRVTQGNRKVAGSGAFRDGLVEIQDAGSQGLAQLAQAAPGELIIDLCAGGGGKTLALAAQAQGEARIIAHDISTQRLTDLLPRAERAGAKVKVADTETLDRWLGQADLVFVDAPCSGSGAWRRNPDAKWQLTPERLNALIDIQAQLLDQAAGLCKAGGRIVYGTCSLFTIENETQVNAFLSRTNNWRAQERFKSSPSKGVDGLFGTVLSR